MWSDNTAPCARHRTIKISKVASELLLFIVLASSRGTPFDEERILLFTGRDWTFQRPWNCERLLLSDALNVALLSTKIIVSRLFDLARQRSVLENTRGPEKMAKRYLNYPWSGSIGAQTFTAVPWTSSGTHPREIFRSASSQFKTRSITTSDKV